MSSDKKMPAGGPSPKVPAGGKDSTSDKLDGPPRFGGTPPADRPSKG